jgi:hypothetical protein
MKSGQDESVDVREVIRRALGYERFLGGCFFERDWGRSDALTKPMPKCSILQWRDADTTVGIGAFGG